MSEIIKHECGIALLRLRKPLQFYLDKYESIFYAPKKMFSNYLIKYIGFIAAFCTTFAFFPQAVKVWKTKSTKDISIWMFLIFNLGVFLWLIYGILIKNYALIFANTITLILSLSILVAKILFK